MGSARNEPTLPMERGDISETVIGFLRGGAHLPAARTAAKSDAYGDDLQLALYVCYELHYRGFAGVDPCLEWDPALLAVRATLEKRFLDALRADVTGPAEVEDALADILVEPPQGTGVPHFLQEHGELRQVREYVVQRSLYHLKEADPHAWVLPRLYGRAKAGMAAVEYDEYGGGRADRVHAQLFANLMEGLGLDTTYGAYLDDGYPEMLALVNLMSLFGLHRRLRGSLVGHFASVEVTSSPASRRLALAMKRTGAGPDAEFFYTEHVAADAVHEQVVRHEVIGGLLDDEPELAADIAFGITSTSFLEDRLTRRFLADWQPADAAADRPGAGDDRQGESP